METTSQPPQVDTDRQQKARKYAQLRRQISFINLGIVADSDGVDLWTDLDTGLRDQLQFLWVGNLSLGGWYPWQVLVYFLALMLAYQIITHR